MVRRDVSTSGEEWHDVVEVVECIHDIRRAGTWCRDLYSNDLTAIEVVEYWAATTYRRLTSKEMRKCGARRHRSPSCLTRERRPHHWDDLHATTTYRRPTSRIYVSFKLTTIRSISNSRTSTRKYASAVYPLG
ncbi:hypothetical protein ARMGADRAFT_814460 [Armillaria gallica]|uniref:Uncharacterized protein n=1 Tax=Armillaria gallica TaxID=47427 RepID=A0A2H3CDL2_ARMGA|nr:hypothetical protein ARMGADRAFT_814460 [Armillaria gallica]